MTDENNAEQRAARDHMAGQVQGIFADLYTKIRDRAYPMDPSQCRDLLIEVAGWVTDARVAAAFVTNADPNLPAIARRPAPLLDGPRTTAPPVRCSHRRPPVAEVGDAVRRGASPMFRVLDRLMPRRSW